MRIVQLTTQNDFYGGEVHLVDLAVGLAARGHAVHAIVRPGSAVAARLAAGGIDVHTLALVDWFEPRGVWALARCLRRLQPDVLHTHTPRDYYLAATATLGTRIHNIGTRHQLRPITFPRLKRPFLHRLSAMIAVSQAVRDGLLASGLPPTRLVTIPNGVAEPAAADAPEVVRTQLGLEREGPVVGFVGRLCSTKGVETLIRAADQIRGRWPGLQVPIIGADAVRGVYRRELEELVAQLGLQSVVRFCGYRPDAARLSAAFDVQAVPSRAEPFGLVTLEAMIRGVPVVATTSGGSREIIRDGVDGLLVEPDDPRAFAGALQRVLADGELARRLAVAGPARVRSRFTLAGQIEATERVYQLACQGADLPAEVGAVVMARSIGVDGR